MMALPKSPTVWAPDTSTVDTQGALRLSGIVTLAALAAHPLKVTAKAVRQA